MLRGSRVVRFPLPSLLTTVFAVLATAACGSKASSPVGPSAVGPSTPTATIRGTVQQGVSASSVTRSGSGSMSGIRVSVVGTTLAALTDDRGRFDIDGVPPSGVVTLRFEAPGLDARLDLSGLTPGQVLTISVQVSGDHVVLAGSDDPSPEPTPSPSPGNGHEGEVEFRGTVQSVSAPDLVVDGRLVHTDASTEVKSHGDPIDVSAIPVGVLVEVEGTGQSDGSVLARKIRVEDDGDDDTNDDNGDDQGDDDGGNSGHGGGGDDGGGHQ
jgi:hypothetical protein